MTTKPIHEIVAEWYEDLPVDGWVDVDDRGLLHIELFAKAIGELKLRAGQFVRIQVFDEPTQKRIGYDGAV